MFGSCVEKLVKNFLASLPGICAVHFLSLEVDILKNGRFANLGNFYFYFWL